MTPIDKMLAKMEYDFIMVQPPSRRVREVLQQKAAEGWRVVSHANDGDEYGWSFVLARKIAEE